MTEITAAITSMFSVVSTTLTSVLGEPALAIFFVAGLVGVAAGILSRLKSL